MFAKHDPEKPIQEALAANEREAKQIKADADAKLKALAAEKANLHEQVQHIRYQKLEAARVKMAERLRPIELQIAKLRAKQEELQNQRQYEAANALVAQVANLYEQRREAIAAA